MGHKEIVLSAGRTSEKSHMRKYGLPEESYILMGDYLEYSLQEAEKHDFKKIYLCAQWAKMVKIAMATPQTHVRFGAIDVKKAVAFLNFLGVGVPEKQEFNTAREIFEFIVSKRNAGAVGAYFNKPLQKVCNVAKKYAQSVTGRVPVETCLVSYSGEIIARSE
jgi:cobalt-precorrin-5B (C1)-methyltransferase